MVIVVYAKGGLMITFAMTEGDSVTPPMTKRRIPRKVTDALVLIGMLGVIVALVVINLTATYTVKFETYGGTEIEQQTVRRGYKLTSPQQPTKEGWIFGGWYTSPELEQRWNFDSDYPLGNITLYAHWIATE